MTSSKSNEENITQRRKIASPRGWLVVFSTFFTRCYFAGTAASNGVFMVEFHRYFEESVTTISWMFTLVGFAGAATAPLFGYLISKFGGRKMTAAGATLVSVAMVTSAFAERIEHLIVTFGALHAIGLVMVLLTGTSVVAQHFKTRFATANGIAALGASVGVTTFPPLVQALIDYYGWHGTFLVLAGLAANNFVAAAAIITPLQSTSRRKTEKTGKENNACSLLSRSCGIYIFHKHPLFTVYILSSILHSVARLFCFIWIFVHAVAIGIPRMQAATLMTFYGGASAFGRLGQGFLVDSKVIGAMALSVVVLTCLSVCILTLAFVKHYAIAAALCVAIGLSMGITSPLKHVNVRQIVGVENLPSALGVELAFDAVVVMSVPLTGKLYDITGDTKTTFYLAAACAAVSASLMAVLAWLQHRKSREVPEEVAIDNV